MHLLSARRPNGVRVLDFRNVRKLSVMAGKEADLMAIQAFIKVTEKLETLDYTGTYQDPTMPYLTHDFSFNDAGIHRFRRIDELVISLNVEDVVPSAPHQR